MKDYHCSLLIGQKKYFQPKIFWDGWQTAGHIMDDKHQCANQTPCVHISGRWEASSTRYRPPWWPLRGVGFPKGTQLENNNNINIELHLLHHLWFTARISNHYKSEILMLAEHCFKSKNPNVTCSCTHLLVTNTRSAQEHIWIGCRDKHTN